MSLEEEELTVAMMATYRKPIQENVAMTLSVASYILNQILRPMRYTPFRDPQAQSSALAALGTLQPWAFRSLNHIEPLDSVSIM